MSCPTTDAESPTCGIKDKSMTHYEELRKKYPNLPESIPRPTRSVDCNKMVYYDGEGAEKQIWMPKGTAHTAGKYLQKGDWEALTKFPVWNNQKYEDAGEAEERERKAWEWLVADEPQEPEKGA